MVQPVYLDQLGCQEQASLALPVYQAHQDQQGQPVVLVFQDQLDQQDLLEQLVDLAPLDNQDP